MGIKNLSKFIKENTKNGYFSIKINDLHDKVIAIDTSLILYQFLIAIKSSDDLKTKNGKITSHIHAILTKALIYIKKQICPIFVFDGKPTELKTKTLENRSKIKQKALENLENILTEEEKIKMLKRSLKITEEQILECQEILQLLGIPFIVSNGEADPQCAYLVKAGIAEAVISEDMDLLAFGTNKLVRGFNNKIEIYNLNNILEELNFSYEQFIELCILFGCDYCETIKGIGSKRAFELIQKYKTIDNIIINTKYKFPENYNHKEIIKYFKNPPIIKLKKQDIKWLPPQLDLLKKKLIEDYDYNPTNVENIIKNLNNSYYNVICGKISKSDFKQKKTYNFI
jgi:flap endonuclease-1